MVNAAVLETVACNGRIGSTPIILTNCLNGETGKHAGFKPRYSEGSLWVRLPFQVLCS